MTKTDIPITDPKAHDVAESLGERRRLRMLRGFPPIVCLCGSTRFAERFRQENLRLTLAGQIVLSIGCDTKSDDGLGLTEEDKRRLDELHFRKIELADYVLVLNVDGYVGDSTRREIRHALNLRKYIEFIEPCEVLPQ